MSTVELGLVPGGSNALRGYLATPAGDGPWPGVVAVHEAWGLDAVMRRQADRLAAAGYLTLAPDLFTDASAKRCVVTALRDVARGDGKGFADIAAARDWLAGRGDCTGNIGLIGFCMGGGFALVSATRGGFDAVSANYGFLPKDMSFAGSAPIVASYGLRDRMMRKAPAKLERALTEADVPHDVKGYPNAGHSFLNDGPVGPKFTRGFQKIMHIGPEPASAKDAWARIEAFFGEHLA